MPAYHRRQPLSRGFTAVELVMAVLLMAVAGLVCARMTTALVKGARYTLRQSAALTAARRALLNHGPERGMVWAAQEAGAARSLSTSTLELALPEPVNVDFSIAGSSVLVKTEGGWAATQALGVTSMTVSYFEIGSDGLIFQSTVAAQASLVQVLMTVQGKTSREKTYSVVSSAWLRNR